MKTHLGSFSNFTIEVSVVLGSVNTKAKVHMHDFNLSNFLKAKLSLVANRHSISLIRFILFIQIQIE